MGCFSGRLMSAASDQKLFCKLCSPFCCSFDEFVEEKVIFLSYSSAILTPPPPSCCLISLCPIYFQLCESKSPIYFQLCESKSQKTRMISSCRENFSFASCMYLVILLEKGMAAHSSILAWRISWTEESGGLQSMGSQRVRHDWVTKHTSIGMLFGTNLVQILCLRSFTRLVDRLQACEKANLFLVNS